MKLPKLLGKFVGAFNSISVKFFLVLVALLIIAFGLTTYINVYFFTNLFREDIVSNAVQMSNVIKRSTYQYMLENHRDALTNAILNIGKEDVFEGVRIYNKIGVIAFSDRLEDLGKVADKKAEQCYVCHLEEPAKGVIPTKDRTRMLKSPDGYRILGLITPIENEPSCYTASCHAHSSSQKLLGILDVKLSLEKGDKRIIETRNKMITYSAILILITVLVKGVFIRKIIYIPIKRLDDATKEVANLNLDVKVEINSRDELGHLAHSFNTMTSQLKESNEAVKSWSSQLEDRVKQKTDELEKAQFQLIQTAKMACKGELSAMVAHEINNPLSGILSYAKVSSKYLNSNNISPEILESVKKNLAFISDESKRCGNIVKNLLLFSRKSSEDFTEEHLNPIIDISVKVVDHSVQMKGLELLTQLDDCNDLIECDANGIRQVMVALIVNSVEATSPGGQITVKTDCHTDKDWIQIKVADSGKGIPEDVLPHIFEPFVSTKVKGTGLGLSVVYGIVEQHAGKIEVESKVDQGTTFTITLPRLRPAKKDG
jgi:two-component system, NtrC family, sensor kinase